MKMINVDTSHQGVYLNECTDGNHGYCKTVVVEEHVWDAWLKLEQAYWAMKGSIASKAEITHEEVLHRLEG